MKLFANSRIQGATVGYLGAYVTIAGEAWESELD